MVLLLLFFFDQQFQDPNCEIALANWLKTDDQLKFKDHIIR